MEQKADRLVINVANSPVAAGRTALEILKKVPGIVVVQEKVTLEEVKVYKFGSMVNRHHIKT